MNYVKKWKGTICKEFKIIIYLNLPRVTGLGLKE